jgi:hypothetical protein
LLPVPSEALVVAHRDAMSRVRGRTAARARQMFDRLGSWDEPDADRFAAAVAPVVAAGRNRAAALTAAYLTRALGVPVGARDLDPRGVAADVMWRRPFVQLWSGLSNGQSFTSALNAASARVDAMAQTDVQLAMTNMTRDVLADPPAGAPRVVGYMRVLTGESCGLCATASTQRYKTSDLMPIHDRCDCGVEPILAGEKPAGRVINRDLLGRLKDQRVDTSDSASLKHVRVDPDGNVVLPQVQVVEHGEIGPVLVDAAHDFKSPADLGG